MLLEENTNIDRKTRYEQSCRDPDGFMTESLDTASDREEPCCRNSITTTTTELKINFKYGQPDIGFDN